MASTRNLGIGFVGLALLFMLLVRPNPASAGPIGFYGSFYNYGAPSSSYAALNGGSFSGTFSLPSSPSLPLSTPDTYDFFTSFSINLYNAAGTLMLNLTQGVNGGGGYFTNSYLSLYGGERLYFYDGVGDYLQLVVSTDFNGHGGLAQSGPGSTSYAKVGSNLAYVAAASIPEPSALATMFAGLGLLLGSFAVRRRA